MNQTNLTYTDFTAIYEEHATALMTYAPSEIGSVHFAQLLGELTDAYPEYAAQYDREQDATLNCMGCGGFGHNDDFCT